jgi:trehalose-phosphatase
VIEFDDPADVAALVVRLPRPLVIGLDVDGVLAPLVDHADDAALLDGVAEALHSLTDDSSIHVAIVSGRSLGGLAQFSFGPELHVIGSHGMESGGGSMNPLTDTERRCLDELDRATVDAVERAGDGAWIERKPASVVLHVRRADRQRGDESLAALLAHASLIDGAHVKVGSNVLELFARHADKGTALIELATRLGVAATVFVGDDVTDEEAFARLGPADVAIKVGNTATIAPHRLRDPDAVLAWLQGLCTSFA